MAHYPCIISSLVNVPEVFPFRPTPSASREHVENYRTCGFRKVVLNFFRKNDLVTPNV